MSTEDRNPRSEGLDEMSAIELAAAIAGENQYAVAAVMAATSELAQAMQWCADAFQLGGRVIYAGAGTSARIAAADAAEMPPTFGVDPNRFVALIAGSATDRAKEGAEDDRSAGSADAASLRPNEHDIVIGLSASGTTPYVLAVMESAYANGSKTIGIANNPGAPLLELADLGILLDTGPEVLAGSTRLKAGTAQKIALNTISTGAMVLAGRVIGNAMSHMTPNNDKLRQRAIGIVATSLGLSEEAAAVRLEVCGWDLPEALK